MKAHFIWIEISVADIDRATLFYENVFECKLKQHLVLDTPMALFNKEQFGIKGCLIQKSKHIPNNSTKVTFFVDVISDVIERVLENGGKVITSPFILRQKNEYGDVIIGGNLIDDTMGYLAEVTDCEDNHFYLYGHS